MPVQIAAHDYLTTYSDIFTTEHEALQLPWSLVDELLGHEHEGRPEDDERLVEILLASGAPAWVKEADGWIDEYGWGLIGPEIIAEER